MVKIDKHISDLLFRYDCVIVPRLGGFVANYAPAKVHPVHHTFNPPSKHIVFNKNLVNNDGLLTNHVAVKESKTYEQAGELISAFVDTCKFQLEGGKRVEIEQVGQLFYNVEHKLEFEPDQSVNYLTDAFGLASFHSPAIKRSGTVKRLEKELKDRVEASPTKEAVPFMTRTTRRRLVAAAIALPFIFTMIWVPLKTDLLKNVNYSNLNPFAKSEPAKYVYAEHKEAIFAEEDFVVSNIAPELNDASINETKIRIGETDVVVKLKEELATVEEEKQDNTSVVVNTNAGNRFRYHIVAGAFQVYSNALQYVEKLRSKNLKASIIGKNDRGLNIVSVGDFNNAAEARQALQAARNTNTEVWLMKD